MIQDFLHRQSFGRTVRAEAWQMLSDFTGSGMEHGLALETAANIFKFRKNRSAAHILMRMRWDLSDGSVLPSTVRYASDVDVLMFSREHSIEASSMYGAAARLTRAQISIRQAIRGALIGQAVSLLALGVLMHVLGSQLFPEVRRTVGDVGFAAHVRIVEAIAGFVAGNWLLALGTAAAAAAVIGLSMRRWSGTGRVIADRMPPWSLHRLETGLTFVMLLVECGRMGQDLTTQWLLDLANLSDPYVKRRIQAIADMSGNDPAGIGAAALAAGFGWPAQDLSATLAAYSRQDEWIDDFSKYLDRWLALVEARVKERAAGLRTALLLLVAAVMAVVISTVFAMYENIQSGL